MILKLSSIAQAYRILVQEQKHQELSKLHHDHNDTLAFAINTKPFSCFQQNQGKGVLKHLFHSKITEFILETRGLIVAITVIIVKYLDTTRNDAGNSIDTLNV